MNKGDLTVLDDVISSDFVNHSTPPGLASHGPEAIKQLITMVRTGFPDVHFTLQHAVGEGDMVVHYATAEGTNTGPFMGMPPTGKRATWTEMHMVRFVNGKAVEHWSNVDMLGLLQQLGVVPMPGAG
jgi:predicted ester cyclase